MHITILIISVVLMTVAGTPYGRSVFVTGGPPEGPYAGKARTALFWGMIVFGILISVATLRGNPHVYAGPAPLVVPGLISVVGILLIILAGVIIVIAQQQPEEKN